ncbi:hypothetical protein [Actinacidiphila oryziradicis]|uniref:Uncharacterized protein n=1 Tax=Actinacidiphila oryziradicis TaxID=2571141 RepID=A0A4U0RTJ6_9ACTN|nr:hypothetical protein [Actinacidiphila oryziradicis]TJZ99429.1 hypothetical protein FCI23_45730 [Actinacidiphila oryziradicis]
MPSFAGDPRHERLVAVLVPLLRRSCPPGGGGFGGSYELRLAVDEAEELGGVDLIRSAMRKAARSLGWSRLQTFGGSYPQAALAGVVDQREIPEEFAAAVEEYRMAWMRASAEVVSQTIQDGKRRSVPGSVLVTAQEFRAAYAESLPG